MTIIYCAHCELEILEYDLHNEMYVPSCCRACREQGKVRPLLDKKRTVRCVDCSVVLSIHPSDVEETVLGQCTPCTTKERDWPKKDERSPVRKRKK